MNDGIARAACSLGPYTVPSRSETWFRCSLRSRSSTASFASEYGVAGAGATLSATGSSCQGPYTSAELANTNRPWLRPATWSAPPALTSSSCDLQSASSYDGGGSYASSATASPAAGLKLRQSGRRTSSSRSCSTASSLQGSRMQTAVTSAPAPRAAQTTWLPTNPSAPTTAMRVPLQSASQVGRYVREGGGGGLTSCEPRPHRRAPSHRETGTT